MLKALGPSPSREALSKFVAGLSKDERRLLLGDARDANPTTPKTPIEQESVISSCDSSLNESQVDPLSHMHRTELTARGTTPTNKKNLRLLPRPVLCALGTPATKRLVASPESLSLSLSLSQCAPSSPFSGVLNSARTEFGGTHALWETRAALAERERERELLELEQKNAVGRSVRKSFDATRKDDCCLIKEDYAKRGDLWENVEERREEKGVSTSQQEVVLEDGRYDGLIHYVYHL